MPTEKMEAPRVLTPEELATIVKLFRESRKWSQETLAQLSGLSVRTIQRVETGEPSGIDTRRALARAFEFQDIDALNKPYAIPTVEELEAERKQFEREHTTLPNEVIKSGRVLCTHYATSQAGMAHAAIELEEKPAADFAALTDYLNEYRNAADLYSEIDKLDVYKEVQGYIDALDAVGIAVCCGVRDGKFVGDFWENKTPIQLRVVYVTAFPKDNAPEKIIVRNRLS